MTPTKTQIFKVKQKVLIIREDCPYFNRKGTITSINGEYHLVRPNWCKHNIELYRNEIKHV